ncbi:MAG: sensor histidine kinase [Jatrophihabitans sp.]
MTVAAVLLALALGLVLGIGVGYALRRQSAAVTNPAAERAPIGARLPALVVEQLTSGVVIVDRDESILLANRVARALGAVSGDRMATDALRTLARSAVDSAGRSTGEVELPNPPSREPTVVSVHAIPLHDTASLSDSRVVAVALLLEDVTDARRLDAVRRDFVANVSHELKTPVGALTLLAEAVQDAADDPVAVARFAGRMQHEGIRLGRLVGELIALSRLEGADRRPQPVPVGVTRVLHEAVGATALAAEQSGISVVCSGGEGLSVAGSETNLVSALANLIDNAIRYSPSNTKVGVVAREVRTARGAAVEITVTDQGIGIAQADLPRVFERFFRVDAARSRATGGTGLGLAIVKHTVTNHGGTVTAWSVEGAGSTFTVTLPLLYRDTPSPDDPSATAADQTHVLTRGTR